MKPLEQAQALGNDIRRLCRKIFKANSSRFNYTLEDHGKHGSTVNFEWCSVDLGDTVDSEDVQGDRKSDGYLVWFKVMNDDLREIDDMIDDMTLLDTESRSEAIRAVIHEYVDSYLEGQWGAGMRDIEGGG